MAENDGMVLGSGHQAAKEREEAKRKQGKALDQSLSLMTRLATPQEKAEFVSLLDDFQSRLDRAFEELESWRAENEQRTARLDNGTAIYRMKDGQYCTADKRIIPKDELPADLAESALTLEEHEAYLRRAKQLSGMQDEIINPGYELAQNPNATVQDIEDFKERMREADAVLDNPEIESDRGHEVTNNEISSPATSINFPLAP